MKYLFVSLLVYGTLMARIDLDIGTDSYHGWYDEAQERVTVVDKNNHKVLTQRLDAQTYHEYLSTERKAISYRYVDFDDHKDLVLVSGWNEYAVYLYREGRFVYTKGLGDLFGCCKSFTHDAQHKENSVIYINSNSAILNYLTYREHLVYVFQHEKPVLIRREMTDHDICATYRITTSYGQGSDKPIDTHYIIAKEDTAKEIFFEAQIEGNRTLRLCKNSYAKYRYVYLVYDSKGHVLTPYEDMQRATLYREANNTVVGTKTFTLMQAGDHYTLTTYKEHNGTEVATERHLPKKNIHGSLEEGISKDETYIQAVTDPKYLGEPMINRTRGQQVRYGDEKGLMIVDDLLMGTSKTFRINIPCGGSFVLSPYWGKNRDILYVDDGEELTEINLKTAQRRSILVYDEIGPYTKMIFDQKGDKALFQEADSTMTRIYLIDLKSLKYHTVLTLKEEAKEMQFDPQEKYMIVTEKNGEKKRIALPQ